MHKVTSMQILIALSLRYKKGWNNQEENNQDLKEEMARRIHKLELEVAGLNNAVTELVQVVADLKQPVS